jgi:hypothetical protein
VTAISCGTPPAGERSEREVADLDRMIDQLVVVRGAIAAESMRRRAI